MILEIREFNKKDVNQAIQFATTGMHFNWYVNNPFFLHLYGRYFWYLESNRATQIIAAYTGDTIAGVLLAAIKGETIKRRSFWQILYVKFFDVLQKIFVPGGIGVYDQANLEMFREYCKDHSPDGEILFLAANPDVKGKGIGTLLLQELERKEKGKKIYLYTDNACTYQFYERRGFDRVGEKKITLHIGSNKVDLQCLLYSKEL